MFKIRNYTITFLFLLISIFFTFFKNITYVKATCYANVCVAWHPAHETCSLNSKCGSEGICEYATREVECPCDNNCNGSCTLPSCPSGYDRTNPNNLCTSDTKTISCSYSNGCGNPCGVSASCYRLETNQTPSAPTSLSMIIDGQSYTLSPNSSTPTRVKYPSTLNDVKVSMPYVATDTSISRELGYIFRANNYGVDNEWIEWTDCTNPRPEDFCKESTTSTTTFTPSSLKDVEVLGTSTYSTKCKEICAGFQLSCSEWAMCCTDPEKKDSCSQCCISYKETCVNYAPMCYVELVTSSTASQPNLNSVLKQNSQGNIGGLYYSLNRCDDDRLYSSVIQTYYKVDTIPEINGDDDCSMDVNEQCTINSIIDDLGGTDSSSVKGCTSTTHTGTEVNNPLKISIESTDANENKEIEGAIIYFSKSGNTPELPQIVSTYTNTNPDEIGIMIRKNGNSWSNTPKIYGTNTNGTWAILNNNTLTSTEGDLVSVNDITITEDTQVTIKFNLAFISNVNAMFNVKSIVLDSYMYLDDGRVDQSYTKKYFDWGVDLTDPTIEDFSEEILSPKEFHLSWTTNDNVSNITNFVINAYRTDTGVNGTTSDISMQDKNNIRLNENGENVPDESGLGLLTDTNTWQFNNLSSNPYSQTKLVNINDNELGTITLHGSAYDQACNFITTSSLQVRLDPWYGTKGGVLYSEGSLGIPAKEMLNNSNTRNFVITEIDKGTELLISSGQYIANLFKPSLGAVRATNIYDTNLRVNFWYNYLFEKFEEQKEYLKQINNISQCNTGENCYIYSTENISIPSGTVCKGRVIVISDKDIHIEPNIESVGGNSGCIFLSGNNITLGSGRYLSSSNIVEYDYIDALMLAENRIEIEYTDGEKSLRDGLEINGSLLSLGSKLNMDSGIYQRRDLRLYNAIYPSLLVNYSYKYTNLSDIFFGKDALLHKREVGSKGL